MYTGNIFNQNKNTLYPRDMTSCPDNWQVRPDGTCQIPERGSINMGKLNEKGRIMYEYMIDDNMQYSYLSKFFDSNDNKYVGSSKKKIIGYYNTDIPNGYDEKNPQNSWINFNDGGWASHGDPYCAIQKWANINNIQWDGIANYNNC